MIQKVWVQNPSGSILELDLRRSGEDTGLLIFNFEGLGPPRASANAISGPSFHGSIVNSVNIEPRIMSLTLAVNRGTVGEEDAKQSVYTFFPIGKTITLGIKTARKNVTIPAIVESNEANQFATVENFVIGLYCGQPYFVDVKERSLVIQGNAAVPEFQFPFSNESLTLPLLTFGEIYTLPTGDLSYPGEVSTGCVIVLSMSGFVEDVTITNANGNQTMDIVFDSAEAYFGDPVEDGDQVIIDTRFAQKSIYFIRGGEWYNMINDVDVSSDWIQLNPGGNLIQLDAKTGISNVETEITYLPLREGV